MTAATDTLAAASMLLAALAVVFSAWSGSIQAAIDDPLGSSDDVRAERIAATRATMWGRAVPLAFAATLLVALYAPRDFEVAAASLRWWTRREGGYDDVAAAFALTQVFSTMLAVHLWRQVRRMAKRR